MPAGKSLSSEKAVLILLEKLLLGFTERIEPRFREFASIVLGLLGVF